VCEPSQIVLENKASRAASGLIPGWDSSRSALGETSCSVVNRAKLRGGEAHITISNTKRRGHFGGDISYVFDRYAESNTSNGWFGVEADDYNLFLTAGAFGSSRERDAKFSPEQAAERLWREFVERAGIEYD
jgi:hypothetical protein